jgi:DNA-binding NarL/FixJ family response regulator
MTNKPSSSNDGSTRKTQEGAEEQRSGSSSSSSRRVKVLLADDHTMFREGMAGMLGSSYGDHVEVVGKTHIGEEAITLAQEEDPDVIIMQVDRTLKKAKDTLRQMREGSSSPPKVIILTMFEEPRMVRNIMELGANAYIHKSATVEELFAAVRTATLDTSEGHEVVVMPQRALELSEDGKVGVPSSREMEILLLTARGMTNRDIGSRLEISESTVKRHLANLYPKMEVSSRGEAVRIALENEWFTIREIEAAIDED